MPTYTSSGKSKLIGSSVIFTTPEDLMKRLTLVTSARRAGNTNLDLRNQAWEIIDKLLEIGIISKTQYDAYVKKHLV